MTGNLLIAGVDAFVVPQLDELGDGDPEAAHSQADRILLDAIRRLGHDAIADAFERARDRVGFWYA